MRIHGRLAAQRIVLWYWLGLLLGTLTPWTGSKDLPASASQSSKTTTISLEPP